MPRPKKSSDAPSVRGKRPIEQYIHDQETRINNPPVGLVDDRGIESLKIVNVITREEYEQRNKQP